MNIREATLIAKEINKAQGSLALLTLITFAESALEQPSVKLEEPVGVNEIENCLGKIEAPIDESMLEWKKTSNPAVVILKNKWSTKIAQALLKEFHITRRWEE